MSEPETTDDGWLTGMDVPTDGWDEGDVWIWAGTERYQSWKDVAAFFREESDVE